MPEHRGQVVDAPTRTGAVDVEHADHAASIDQQLRLVQIAVGREDGAGAGRPADALDERLQAISLVRHDGREQPGMAGGARQRVPARPSRWVLRPRCRWREPVEQLEDGAAVRELVHGGTIAGQEHVPDGPAAIAVRTIVPASGQDSTTSGTGTRPSRAAILATSAPSSSGGTILR